MLPTILTSLQVILAFGLLNVWLVRAKRETSFRGGASTSLCEEFASYGLPAAVFWVVGFLKLSVAIGLLVGIWVPAIVMPAALLLSGLMVGALIMHLKVKDALIKSLPAFLMLLMSLCVIFLSR